MVAVAVSCSLSLRNGYPPVMTAVDSLLYCRLIIVCFIQLHLLVICCNHKQKKYCHSKTWNGTTSGAQSTSRSYNGSRSVWCIVSIHIVWPRFAILMVCSRYSVFLLADRSILVDGRIILTATDMMLLLCLQRTDIIVPAVASMLTSPSPRVTIYRSSSDVSGRD